MMSAGFQHESTEQTKVSANSGLILAAIYAVLILLVYYAQTTTVRLEELNGQAAKVLNYQNGGLPPNYDPLGYGIMALSTFFIGLSIQAKNKPDLWLKTADGSSTVFSSSVVLHANDRYIHPYG